MYNYPQGSAFLRSLLSLTLHLTEERNLIELISSDLISFSNEVIARAEAMVEMLGTFSLTQLSSKTTAAVELGVGEGRLGHTKVIDPKH